VVMLTSDNGVYFGEHRLGEKSSAYEESIRVPFYVRAPWTTVPRKISQPVINNDLAPTIAQFAGAIPWHAVDGRSIVPLLQNPNTTSWRRIFLIEHWFEVEVPLTTAPTMFAVRTGESTRPRMLARYPTLTSGMTAELYDLSADPSELENVIMDPQRSSEATRLALWLGALRTCRALTCVTLENSFTFE
jgi:N-acetylglucosamine-6-sulfatase